MIVPTAKDFTTAQAQAALRGLELAQVPAVLDAEPAYTLTGHVDRIDLSDWAQVVVFLEGARHG